MLVFGVGYAGAASAGATKKASDVYVNQLMSFSTFGGIMLSAVLQSQGYSVLQANLPHRLGSMTYFAAATIGKTTEIASGSFALSADCALKDLGLAQTTANALLLETAIPVVLFAVVAFKGRALVGAVVAGNCFLPAVFANVFMCLPCYHMEMLGASFQIYNVHSLCWEIISMRLMQVLLGGLVCIAIGPALWAYLSTQAGKCRAPHVLYLTAAYRPDFDWGEVVVLIRKMLLKLFAKMNPITYSPAAQLLPTLLIIICSLFFVTRFHPYAKCFWNQTEAACLWGALVMFTLASYLVAEPWSQSVQVQIALLVSVVLLAAIILCTMMGLLIHAFLSERRDASSDACAELMGERHEDNAAEEIELARR